MKSQRVSKAEDSFQRALAIFKRLAEKEPNLFDPYVIETLSNLAALYSDAGELELARKRFKECRELLEKLSRQNPAIYKHAFAEMLSNMGGFYRRTGEAIEAERCFNQAESILESLIASDRVAYLPSFARVLSNEIPFYTETRQYSKAETSGLRATACINELILTDPVVFDPLSAKTLQYLAILHSHMGKHKEAESDFEKAVAILRPLAAENLASKVELALALNNQAIFYQSIHDYAKATVAYKESLQNYSLLAQTGHSGFELERAHTQYNLAELKQVIPDLDGAEELYKQALATYRTLANNDLQSIYFSFVVRTECGLALLHFKLQRVGQARQEIEDLIKFNRSRIRVRAATGAQDDLAESLFLAAYFVEDANEKCAYIREADQVAIDPAFKNRAHEAAAACAQAQ